MDKRLDSLDGVRAIAILWVAIYHYAVFWSPAGKGLDLLPYDDMLAWIPLAAVGDLGVSLFFIVSGLVIALSLTRSDSAKQFALRRLARLWPTLLICGLLTFVVTLLLGPEALRRSFWEFLISMTFVPPAHVGKVVGTEMEWLDGAYWSLWVEVRFYAVAAALYFLSPRGLVHGWVRFAAICAGIHMLAIAGVGPADAMSRLLFAEYQPYFTAGIALACLMRGEDRDLSLMLIAASVVLALFYTAAAQDWQILSGFVRLVAVAGCFAVAACAVLRPGWLPFLQWAPLTALGRASYGYYLLHQNLGLALLLAVPITGVFSIIVMLIVQAGLIWVALALHNRVERPFLKAIRSRIDGPKAPRVVLAQRPRALRTS